MKEVPAKTELAEEISKKLKKRGFKFVGPTMVYAFMQAAGFVNDHTVDCFRYTQLSLPSIFLHNRPFVAGFRSIHACCTVETMHYYAGTRP